MKTLSLNRTTRRTAPSKQAGSTGNEPREAASAPRAGERQPLASPIYLVPLSSGQLSDTLSGAHLVGLEEAQ